MSESCAPRRGTTSTRRPLTSGARWWRSTRSSSNQGAFMFCSSRLSLIAALAIGALGGYLAASGRVSLTPRSEAAPPAQTSAAPAAPCCEGADRGVLLARADIPAAAALPQLPAQPAGGRKPNIVVIWGDDIGTWNVSAYSHGMMGRTPNIDRIGKEGIIFTDHYGQPSCTAGRAAFVTGQLPIRSGMTTVGIPGSTLGLQKEDPTIAEVLKSAGYATAQFGKNHLGDR